MRHWKLGLAVLLLISACAMGSSQRILDGAFITNGAATITIPTSSGTLALAGGGGSNSGVSLANNTGSTLPALTPVRVDNSGDLAVADPSNEIQAAATIGVLPSSIANAASGAVITQGLITNIASPAVPGPIFFRPERTDPFSFSFWIKSSVTTIQTIFWTGRQNAIGNPHTGLFAFTLTNQLYVRLIHDDSINNSIYVRAGATVTDGAWHHLAVTYDGGSLAAGLKIYEDGSVQSNTIIFDALTGSIVGDGPIWLGSGGDGAGSVQLMDGNLDEFAFYRSELSAGDVTAVYNSGSPNDLSLLGSATGLKAWYRFEAGLSPADTFGGPIYDRKGTARGTPFNTAASFIDVSSPGGAFSVDSAKFDGINDYVDLTNGNVLYASKTGILTNVKPATGVNGFVIGDSPIKIGTLSKNQSNPAQLDLIVNVGIQEKLR